MAKATKQPKRTPSAESGWTGRYAICPNSNVAHALIAKQVKRGPSGGMWFACVCGFRGYFPKGQKILPFSREDVLAAGALIPDELTAFVPPQAIAPSLPPQHTTTRRTP